MRFLESLPEEAKQNLSYILAGMAIIALFLAFIIPMAGASAKYRAEAAQKQAEFEKAKKLLAEYRSYPKDTRGSKNRRSILASIETTAQSLSVKKKMGQIKSMPAGKGREGADVTFSDLDAKEIASLLSALQKEKITASKIKMKDNDLDGLWNVSLVLEEDR